MLALGTTEVRLTVTKKFPLYRPKDALRAIKKRIVGNKNFKEVMLALTVSAVLFVYTSTFLVLSNAKKPELGRGVAAASKKD